MVHKISIDVGKARSAAGKFHELSNQSSDILRQLDSSVSNLQSNWEGASYKRFMADFEAWKQKMQSFASQLSDIGSEIDRVTSSIEAEDIKLANR